VPQGPGADSLELLAAVALLLGAIHHRQALARALGPVARRLHPPAPVPNGRPIESVAADARRLHQRFRCPPKGIRFAKYEGVRGAYDAVLAEACTTLGHQHLFDVLRPGSDRDAERERVENLLDCYGFHLQDLV
jgi:hypothetical protein